MDITEKQGSYSRSAVLPDFDTDSYIRLRQCFRWRKRRRELYRVAFGRVVKVSYDRNGEILKMYGTSGE